MYRSPHTPRDSRQASSKRNHVHSRLPSLSTRRLQYGPCLSCSRTPSAHHPSLFPSPAPVDSPLTPLLTPRNSPRPRRPSGGDAPHRTAPHATPDPHRQKLRRHGSRGRARVRSVSADCSTFPAASRPSCARHPSPFPSPARFSLTPRDSPRQRRLRGSSARHAVPDPRRQKLRRRGSKGRARIRFVSHGCTLAAHSPSTGNAQKTPDARSVWPSLTLSRGR
ncbi:hypothetical protein B0H14DRAFT_260157 [Mycena olivaceomarginata]|nr:hypothetical protein B0H14DRAFT_260157 [Mycena olivaceomarginata]